MVSEPIGKISPFSNTLDFIAWKAALYSFGEVLSLDEIFCVEWSATNFFGLKFKAQQWSKRISNFKERLIHNWILYKFVLMAFSNRCSILRPTGSGSWELSSFKLTLWKSSIFDSQLRLKGSTDCNVSKVFRHWMFLKKEDHKVLCRMRTFRVISLKHDLETTWLTSWLLHNAWISKNYRAHQILRRISKM